MTPTIIVYGPVSQPIGMGTAARAAVYALDSVGAQLSVVDTSTGGYELDPLIAKLLNKKVNADFHLFCGTPLTALPLSLSFDRMIALCAWETEQVPISWSNVLNQMLDVWAPSQYNVDTFGKQLQVKCFRWPHGRDPGLRVKSSASREPCRLQVSHDSFVFYSIFHWQDRKGSFETCEAFLRAFQEDCGPRLLLKVRCSLGQEKKIQEGLAMLRRELHSTAPITVINECWRSQDILRLMKRGDCYVSLHKGEGWCYPLFEAVCRGTPVIATGYSGPLDYLDPQCHRLIKFRLGPVCQKFAFYDETMTWAQPDVLHAAELMQDVYSHPEASRALAQKAGRRISAMYTDEKLGTAALNRLLSL